MCCLASNSNKIFNYSLYIFWLVCEVFFLFFHLTFSVVVVSATAAAEQVFELYLHVRQIQNTRYKIQNPNAASASVCICFPLPSFSLSLLLLLLLFALHGRVIKVLCKCA